MNRTGVFTVFSAVAVSTTKSWTAGEFPLYEVEVATTGFSGTLDLQSAHTDTAAEYQNTRYLERIASAAPSTAQLSYTTNTSRKTYYVLANSYLRAVMVRTAGSITLKARGLSVLLDSLMFEATPMSLADGSDVAEGATTDAAATAGGTGTLSAKLRRATQGLEDLKSLIVLAAGANRIGKVTVRNSADAADIDPVAEATFTGRLGEVQATPTANTLLGRLKDLLTGIVLAAGTNIVGKVGIDQTTPGTTDSVTVATGQGAGAAIGATTGAAVTSDVNGTIQQYLRGLVKLHADVWDSVNHRLNTAITAALPAGEAYLGQVGSKTVVAAASTMTRPADVTAYATGDLVANNTVAGSVTPLQFTIARVAAGSGMIRRVRLRKSGTSVTSAQFRLHLYGASPTPANGDNGAWSTNQSTYVGALDVIVDRAFTDGAAGNGTPVVGSEINFALASGQVVYGLLEARAAYTPASAETFDVALEVLQN